MIPERRLAEAEPIGKAGELNLEALAAAAPDLILVMNFDADQVGVETFAEIAPTIVVDASPPFNGFKMWEKVALIAEAVGVPRRVAEVSTEYDSAAEAVNAVTDGQSVAFVRPFPDRLSTYDEGSELDPTFADAGLTLAPPPPGAEADDFGIVTDLSPELVPELEGDFMLIYLLDINEEQFREGVPVDAAVA